ncbi:inter-alpha-trypsin inhibitor heavy chain H3-like isoform X2 [Rana temporaria]|uniref:inter-alpha-trypsin inhibitor heavy chain H3-like isoform X2 n=1 Tax=Rana temporaria TaxID=8407 RepID=UPI001AAC8ED9|nr:inter-alpha-trypsin inhibitor heavy chain H3-like isoform X2 [Rana temporaria]
MGSYGRRTWILALAICAVLGARPGDGETNMDIHSMRMETRVTSRFARTLITTEVQNPSNSSQEAVFDIELPKTAFITNFSMTVDKVTTVGTVKEKADAKRTYQKAVSRGQSAGLVQSTGRKMEHFKISVNVGALAKVTFRLTYEELLKRQLGNYELYLRVKPRGLVENFQIDVEILEPQGISFLNAVGTFISNELTDFIQINRTETKAHIEFKPTLSQQRSCPKCVETLLDGDLMIKYDVKRENSAGKLQVINGYFVHYFAPPSLKRIPKNVVFVIDRSGSMHGNKIKQTYEAFLKILEDVPEEDYFAILKFDDKVEKWKKQLVQAVPGNIKKAKEFVSQITARGGTDINKALLTAAKMLTNATFNNQLPEVSASIIIFLSDGEPTSGTTNHDKIIDNVKRSLEGRASLYCLGFGNDVDYNFLEKLSLRNGGLARRIYEDSDSALQLQGFYNEVAYPMLLNVHLQYLDNSVDYLTQNNFKHYYQGSEIIVSGFIANNSLEILTAEVTAQGVSEPFSVKLKTNIKEEEEVEKEQHYVFGDFIERLWAYLTIEQLLTRQISVEGEEKKNVTEKALNLSLKYNFVTPLTSLVVTRPEEEDEANKHLVATKPNENDEKDEYEFDDIPGSHDVASNVQHMDSHYYVDYDSALEDLAPVQPTLITASTQDDCEVFHVLLKQPKASEQICIQVSQADDVYITLIHDATSGVTLNGRPMGDQSFGTFGLLNTKLGLKVEIGEDKVAVTRGSELKAYNWNSSFELDGFLKKDGEKITVTIKDGVGFTIFRVDRSFRLSLLVEDQHSPTNHTSGVIGQLLNNKTSFHADSLAAGDQIFPLRSHSDCDFTPYGAENRGSCLFISLKTNDLISAESYIVSDIFTVP